MFTTSRKTAAILDIGSSKVVAVIVEKENNRLSVLGIGESKSFGIKNSIIVNNKLLSLAISNAVYEAEKAAKKNVDSVVVNVSNIFINSTLFTVRSSFAGRQIDPRDIKKIKNIVFSKVDVSKNEILKYQILKHDLDDMKNVVDPEFMFANLLVSYVHLVTIPLKYLVGLGAVLLSCQLKVSKFVLSSEASASVCLTSEERQGGCVFIDIGAGVSDYSVYDKGDMAMCGSVPLAGGNITKDVANYFSIGFADAEKLKENRIDISKNYNKEFVVLTQIDSKDLKLDLGLLNKIVAARIYEIIEIILKKAQEKKQLRHCLNKIVITGGSSKIKGLQDFITKKTGIPVRIATPQYAASTFSKMADPAYSTTLGLVRKINFLDDEIVQGYKGRGLKRFLLWIKQNF